MTRRVLIFAVLAAAVLGAAPASQAAPINARERADLQRDLSRESRRIAQQKHDGQIR